MGFVLKKFTSAKVDIPDKARKKIEYQYHYEIVSIVERFKTPKTLVINLDQTQSLMVPGRNHKMAFKGSKNFTIADATDKRSITATFAIILSGNFLPMQLMYGGETVQSFPRFQFLNSFSLSFNEKHY